jgi:hypothetical protein
MGLASIRLKELDQATKPCRGHQDGGKPHPYYVRKVYPCFFYAFYTTKFLLAIR